MTGKPRFFYARGTSYILNILNGGFKVDNANIIYAGDFKYNVSAAQTNAAIPGLDGRSVAWTGDPASDPFCMLMNPQIWDIRQPWYPASTLGMGASIDVGITNTINEINQMPTGTPFAIGGYSQGAAVMSGVLKEIQTGSLTSRASDFMGGVCFGNPRRQLNFRGPVGGTWSGAWDDPGSDTGGGGSFPLTGDYARLTTSPDNWVEFTTTDDIFSSAGSTTIGQSWRDANSLFLDLLESQYVGQFLSELIGSFLSSQGIGPTQVTPMANAITAAFTLAGTVNNFVDVMGKPFSIAGAGHTQYPAVPPIGDPDNGLTSFQIALKYLDTLADEYARSPSILPPTSAGWATKLYPPATTWEDTPGAAAAMATTYDYGAGAGGGTGGGADLSGSGIWFVTDFGAVGDGVHDDQPAFMAAIEAAVENGGGTIWVPPGDYALDAPIAPLNMDTIWDGAATNVKLAGIGYRGLSGLEPGGARLQAKGDYPVIGGWWYSCHITNFCMDVEGNNSPAIKADISKSIISHNELIGWVGYGMQLCTDEWKNDGNPTYLNKIEYNHIQQSNGIGLYASYLMWDSYIRYNNIGSTDTNIMCEGGPHKIHYNWLDGETGPNHNIWMANVGHTTEIVGNYMENCQREAVLIERPSWETGDRRLSFKFVGNQILNGGHNSELEFPAVRIIGNADGDTGKLVGLIFNDNQFFDDEDGHWAHAVEMQNIKSATIVGNEWSNNAYTSSYAMRILNCEDVQVYGNAGGSTIKTT